RRRRPLRGRAVEGARARRDRATRGHARALTRHRTAPRARWDAVRDFPAVRNRLFVPLLPIFALTGFSALTLQVVWQRVISLHSGVDLSSTTTVVAAFLGGLGVGSLLGGWLADRLGPDRSLAAFALANAGIGVFAWISL